MTSRVSFFKLVLAALKRNTWSVALTIVVTLLTMPVPMAMLVGQDYYQTYNPIEDFFSSTNVSIPILIIVFAFVMSVSFFAYTHSKVKLDFYHSQPISRTKLFGVNYVSGILAVLPIFLISLGLSLAIAVASGYGNIINYTALGMVILESVVYYLAIYTIGVFCAIICGHTIVTMLLYVFTLFAFPLYVLAHEGFKGIFYITYAMERGLEDLLYNLSPIVQYFAQDLTTISLIAYLLGTAIVAVFALFLYKIMPSETAGSAISFNKSRILLKYYVVTLFAAGLTILFYGINSTHTNSYVWLAIGAVIGIALMHWIVEIIYEFDVRSIRKGLIPLAIYSVIFAGYLIVGVNDLTNYNESLPDRDKIESVYFDVERIQNIPQFQNMYYDDRMKLELTSPEIIDAVYAMAENGVERLPEFYNDTDTDNNILYDTTDAELVATTTEGVTTLTPVSDELSDYRWIEIYFTLENGQSFARSYPVIDRELAKNAFNIIYNSNEFLLKTHPVFTVPREDVAHIAAHTEKDLATENVIETQTNDSVTMQNILNALSQDLQNTTYLDIADKKPIGILNVSYFDEWDKRALAQVNLDDLQFEYIVESMRYSTTDYEYSSSTYRVPLYDEYVNVLSILSGIGFDYTDKIDVANISQITLVPDHYINNSLYDQGVTDEEVDNIVNKEYVITDKADIEALMENAIIEEFIELMGYESRDYYVVLDVNVVVDGGTTSEKIYYPNFYYAENKTPLSTIEKYLFAE